MMLARDVLELSPETTSAFRFMAISLAQATCILTLNYAWRLEQRYPGHRLALVGWAIESQAIVLHQGYYWIYWLLMARNPDGLVWWREYRDFTSVCIVAMAVGWLLVSSPYLVVLFGRWWWIGGTTLAAALWLIGWGAVTWL